MHKSLLNQQKDFVQPCPCVWCFAELELGEKSCGSSFHSCTTCIKTRIWRGRTVISEDLCNPYDKKELVFSLESVVGPVCTCLVLVMFPVFRCLLCIQLPATHLAALDFCHRGQGCSKALRAACTTSAQQPLTCTKWTWTCCPKWFCEVLAPCQEDLLSA